MTDFSWTVTFQRDASHKTVDHLSCANTHRTFARGGGEQYEKGGQDATTRDADDELELACHPTRM